MASIEKVIKDDYCIGCGGCAYAQPDKFEVRRDKFGMNKAVMLDESLAIDITASKVCPFSDETTNENELANQFFDNSLPHYTHIGKYQSCYVGHVTEGDFREKGSSGGFGKWMLNELLRTGEVDYVVQVTPVNEQDNLFDFQVFASKDEIINGSKSAYYPVRLDGILNHIKENPGSYAVTAIPCFAKMLRNVMLADETINERIRFISGIICGHLKSSAFAESYAWQLDVKPDDVREIEFRGKIPGRAANDKGVYALDSTGTKSAVKSSRDLFGGIWGHSFFKYKACDYCDDVVAEAADIAVGDAWLPNFIDDHKGGSVLVVRNPVMQSIIDNAIEEKRVDVAQVKPETVYQSQESGIRHRTEGLAWRVRNTQKQGRWVPQKRAEALNTSVPGRRKNIYKTREKLRDESHTAFLEAKRRGSFKYFRDHMMPLLEELESRPLYVRLLRPVYNRLKSLIS